MIAFRTDGRLDHSDPISDLLWDHGCVGILEDRTDLVAYFPSKRPLPLDGRWEQPDDTDYLAAYFASLKPIRLDGLVIAPTHRKVRLTVGEKVLWLDPGMAFGSGHHETTQLALGALAALDLRGRRVLDVGSGSGILAIAADLMGAAQAEGLDIDAATIAVAEANAEMNRSRATFRAGELDASYVSASIDILVANLYAELHLELLPRYAQVLSRGGAVLLTGILAAKSDMVRRAVAPLVVRHVVQTGDWVLFDIGRTG